MQVSVSLRAEGFDVAADLERLSQLLGTLPSDLAQVAADVGTPAVLDAAEAIRGSLSMSNNKQGRRLDALPIVRPGSPHAEVEIQAVPRGAWTLVNNGAEPYEIRPKRGPGGRRTRGTKRALSTPYGLYGRVNHPGQRRTGAWDLAMEDAEAALIDAIDTAFTVAVEPDGDAV